MFVFSLGKYFLPGVSVEFFKRKFPLPWKVLLWRVLIYIQHWFLWPIFLYFLSSTWKDLSWLKRKLWFWWRFNPSSFLWSNFFLWCFFCECSGKSPLSRCEKKYECILYDPNYSNPFFLGKPDSRLDVCLPVQAAFLHFEETLRRDSILSRTKYWLQSDTFWIFCPEKFDFLAIFGQFDFICPVRNFFSYVGLQII